MTTAKKRMTAEDLFRLPDDGAHRYELIDGVLVEMPPNNLEHSDVTFRASSVFDAYIRPRGLGRIFVGDPGFVLQRSLDKVRAPDIAFIAQDRLPSRSDRRHGFSSVMPDLVAEVVSPGDSPAEVAQKVAEWLAAGVRLVLALYPDTQSVIAHHSATDVRRYAAADILDAEPVLPGFACPVAALFE